MACAFVPPEILVGQRSLFARMARAGVARVGWKIGHAIDEVDAMGVGLPVVGWISAGTVLKDGDAYSAGNHHELRAETEIVVEIACTVEPGADDNVVREAIAGLRVALEIVDVARPRHDARSIVEGNVFHRAVAFGARLAALTDAVGAATLTVNETVHHQDEDPPCLLSAVRNVAGMLAACGGVTVEPGDKILTGSLVHVPVSPGDDLCAEIGGLGNVTARVVR